MIHLSFVEEVKDKASRIIPTAYMEIVEECTAPSLPSPSADHTKFLCMTVNKNTDAIVDVVRALRRRVTNDNPAIQHLTVMLIEVMMRECTTSFHLEVVSQKGFLRDLEKLATEPPKLARGMQAREAALHLILNLSVWFAGHPDPRMHLLTTLAGDVLKISGPHAFDGVKSDNNVRVKLDRSAQTQGGNQGRQQPQQQQQQQQHSSSRPIRERRPIVDAIPINLPTEKTISTMLETCVAFSEYLNNAERGSDGTAKLDEVIISFQNKVAEDQTYVTTLISSNLKVDKEVLRSVSDSQTAVLKSMNEKRSASPTNATTPAVPSSEPKSSSPAAAPKSEAPAPATAAVPAPPAAAPAPNYDDLFGAPPEPTPAQPPAAAEPAAATSSPNKAPANDLLDDMFTQQEATASPEQAPKQHVDPTPAPIDPFAANDLEEAAVIIPPPPPAEEEEENEEPYTPTREEKAAEEEQAEEQVAAAPQPPVVVPPAPSPAPVAPTAAAPKVTSPVKTSVPLNDDDFDAFLEGR